MKTNHRSEHSQDRGESVSVAQVAVIKLGLDVHADSIRVVRQLDHATPQPAQKFSPEQFLEWAKKQTALASKVHSYYEAGSRGQSRMVLS